MENVQHSQAYLRKRKMLTVLPLLVIPFLTLLFWALGGGRGNAQNREVKGEGLNLNLPNAALKDEKGMDKLSFYDLAEKDSNKLVQQVKNDPYLKRAGVPSDSSYAGDNEIERLTGQTASKFNQISVTTGLRTSPYSGTNTKPEDVIMQKLSALQKELNQPTVAKKDSELAVKTNGEFSSEVDRLEQMMLAVNTDSETDPEMQQLQTTLDKMLDVQHPERVRERIKEKSKQQKGKVFPIATKLFKPSISLLDTSDKQRKSSAQFYGLNKTSNSDEEISVDAVIHQTQVLVDGAVIKLRLKDEIFINGITIPKGSFVFGIVSLNGERLACEINSIRLNNQLFPVKLQVHDMDGLPGIYIPGAITHEVAKSSVDNAAQMLEITSLDPSLKAQATNAGLSAVKSLLTKKTKLVKVSVKDGYKILLKDQNN
jgi:conjugative transposon TraM protein